MRFYRIEIRDPQGKEIVPGSLGNLPISSLLPNGQTNTAALNVELDVPVAPCHAPAGNAYLRIWGLGLADLGSAFNLNPKTQTNPPQFHSIAIYGGFSAGFPLANPAQKGLLVRGSVYQAFGNWLGTEQTVDIILAPPIGSVDNPINLTLNWLKGTTLASALRGTLSNAFPGIAPQNLKINLSDRLVQNYDNPGIYGSLTEMGTFLNKFSKLIITDPNYLGVQIAYDGQTLNVYDGTTPTTKVKRILFTDLIGQPTWIAPGVIQVKLVMRGDLDLFDTITLPPGLVTNTAAAQTGLSGNPGNLLTFSGSYQIQQIHHWGSSRQSDAASWNTTIDCTPAPQTGL